MNPYRHQSIQNQLDHRLVDCFTSQNPSNDWLLVEDVASWVYETNQPSDYQKAYVFRKLISILGMPGTQSSELSFLQRGYVTTSEGEDFAFRMKAPAQAKTSKQLIVCESDHSVSPRYQHKKARVAQYS